MSTIVRLGPEYFPDPTKGKPISSGSLYIGEPDLDPEIVANQIQVSAIQENGTSVSISQPISTSAGGVPLYNGSPVTLTVDASYSLKLLDSSGGQVYYTANSFVQGSGAEVLYLSSFSCDLSSAVSSIGATVSTLVVDCNTIIASGATVTIPTTLLLDIIKGGSIDGVAGGGTETLAFSGLDPSAGLYGIFGTDLTVTGLKSTNPIWHGGVGDDSSDDSSAIDKAFAATTKIEIPKGYIFLSDGSTITQDGTFIIGEGEIHASGDVNNLLLITADGVTIDGPVFRGTGNTEQSGAIPEDDRICLIKSTGDRTVVKNTKQYIGYQIFTFLYGSTDSLVENNYFIGGVGSMTSTAYQGVRGSGVVRSKVIDNFFVDDGSGNVTVEAINFVNTLGDQGYNTISRNHVEACYDHGIYVISGIADVLEGNITISDGAGIVYGSRSNYQGSVDADYPGATVANNSITAGSGVGVATVGLHLRDTNNCKAIGNTISGFPTPIQMSPNQFNSTDNRMDNNIIAENTCVNFDTTAINIGQAAKSLGSMSNNSVRGNIIKGSDVAEDGIVWSMGSVDAFNNSVIYNVISNLGGGGISVAAVDQVVISYNEIHKVGEDGINASTVNRLKCDHNVIIDAGQTTGVFYGINLATTNNGTVLGNYIENLISTTFMDYGMKGNNTCTQLVVRDNIIRRMDSGPFSQMENWTENTVVSNRTGDDPLTGTVTLTATASTSVSNDNIQTGAGIETTILLTPVNDTAAQQQAGADLVYGKNPVNETSFTVTTNTGAAATVGGIFYYEIR